MRKMHYVVCLALCSIGLPCVGAGASSLSDLPPTAQARILNSVASRHHSQNSPLANWAQLAELTPSDSITNDFFGISIAISGNTVVVGDFDANTEQYGEVDVYVKPASGWMNMTQTARLTSSDNGQGFGTSVAIDGNTIVVGREHV